MNTIFITNAEIYEKDLEITVRYEDKYGPHYLPVIRRGAGISLVQMKNNTKINHLTGEIIPNEKEDEKLELFVFFYMLEDERQNIEKCIMEGEN